MSRSFLLNYIGRNQPTIEGGCGGIGHGDGWQINHVGQNPKWFCQNGRMEKGRTAKGFCPTRLEKISEHKCIQIIHVGPYSTEPETIEKMSQFMVENNYVENGLHHEIYLSDPRKTAPEKMKTILRQPIKSIDD